MFAADGKYATAARACNKKQHVIMCTRDAAHAWQNAALDTLGIEPRPTRMLSGYDTTTPRALEGSGKPASQKG